MKPQEVKTLIEDGIPGATATVSDLTGTGDHFRADVVAPAFEGKSMIEQHQMVYAALGDRVGGPIHALQLFTKAK
ncbi:MAG TPA: BolA family protein [Myxococcales bacterium LLY-WYZ-16_1]|jgi:stress-induced morphogen|nr:BolA family protein [Myxococcales bacterium LLY-WYZ-16_1]